MEHCNRWLFSANSVFCAFLFLEAAFNRNFNYLSFHVGAFPIYATELFLFALMLFTLPVFLTARSPRWTSYFIYLLSAFWVLFLVKLLGSRHGVPADIFRHAALGYYSGFGLCSFVFIRQAPRAARFYFYSFALGTLVTLPIFLISQGTTPGHLPAALGNYHGLPALMCIGLLALSLCTLRCVNFSKHPLTSALFIILSITVLFFSGRGVAFSFISSLVLSAVLLYNRLNRQEKGSLAAAFLILAGSMVFRQTIVSHTNADQSLSQAWHSWETFPTVISRWRQSFSSKSSPVVSPQNNVVVHSSVSLPRTSASHPIVYSESQQLLHLTSPALTPAFANYRFSSSDNNVVWRLELWRLATQATLSKFPIMGFPLSTNVNYDSFEVMDYTTKADFHNAFVSFLCRFGLLGLCFYMTTLVMAIERAWSFYKTQRNQQGLAYIVCILFFVILSCFNVLLESPYGGPLFWILIGCCLGMTADDTELSHRS